jgi:dTDP-4-amino-4,6-dideoxygalactose transaminase
MEVIENATKRGQLIDGPHINKFERAFASRLGRVRAAATSYGRMAFYYILKAMRLPAGSEIVLPALTFWVIPEMARVAGLRPVFADVDPHTFNMTADSLERVITPKTAAVVPTHLWGLPCDMAELLAVARRHRLVVIEDCAHALGATYRDRPVGTFGDAAFFSFQTLKPLNTYGGGMAITPDPQLGARIWLLAQEAPPPAEASVRKKLWRGRIMRLATRPDIFTWTLFPILWTSARLKVNFDVYFWEGIRPLDVFPPDYRERYSNVQAALGLEALKHIDDWTRSTRANAARLSASLGQVPGVVVPETPTDRTHAFYQYCAYVPARTAVVRACLDRGVDIESLHVDVCSDVPMFHEFASNSPGAEEAGQSIQIPAYASLTSAEIDRIVSVVRDAVTTRSDLPRTWRVAPNEPH